jgi:hypothetical protein
MDYSVPHFETAKPSLELLRQLYPLRFDVRAIDQEEIVELNRIAIETYSKLETGTGQRGFSKTGKAHAAQPIRASVLLLPGTVDRLRASLSCLLSRRISLRALASIISGSDIQTMDALRKALERASEGHALDPKKLKAITCELGIDARSIAVTGIHTHPIGRRASPNTRASRRKEGSGPGDAILVSDDNPALSGCLSGPSGATSLDIGEMAAGEATRPLLPLEYGVPGCDVLAVLLKDQEAKSLKALRHVKVPTESFANEKSLRRLLADIRNFATELELPDLKTGPRQGASWRSLRILLEKFRKPYMRRRTTPAFLKLLLKEAALRGMDMRVARYIAATRGVEDLPRGRCDKSITVDCDQPAWSERRVRFVLVQAGDVREVEVDFGTFQAARPTRREDILWDGGDESDPKAIRTLASIQADISWCGHWEGRWLPIWPIPENGEVLRALTKARSNSLKNCAISISAT